MIRTLLLDADGQSHSGGDELIALWREQPDSRIWIDLQSSAPDEQQALLEAFDCHPLAIIDAQRERHPPKVEEFEAHTLIIYRGISSFDAELNYAPQQVTFFIGERFLISLHPSLAMSIDRMWGQDGSRLLAKSPGQLALKVMHLSAGFYLESLLQFETQLSDLEDGLIEAGNDGLMKRVISYKSRLVKMRRIFNYHQAITRELMAYDYDHLPREDADTLHAVNDVHERFERLHSLTQMYYDICGDLVDGYISISSHQLNITMRVLTVITAIFVPLGFLVGLYGMNFAYMPELGYRFGYFVLLGVMVLIATSLVWVFRRKGWM